MSQWIDVNERLPEHSDLVLIWVSPGETSDGAPWPSEVDCATFSPRWGWNGGDAWLTSPEPTHWMEVPEGPAP